MKRNKMLIVFAFVFVLYALLCTFVYVKPERFFYKPYDYFGNIKNVQDDVLDISEVEYYDYGNMKVKGWLYLNKSKNSNSKVILFLHGNAYNLERYYHKLVPFADAGYSFFLPEYRGFGGQGVKIRQKFLTQDSLNAAKFLNQQGFANENIVVYGMSLGAHNALHTVVNSQQNGKYNALILEVPFTSLPDAAKYHTTFKGVNLLPLDLLIKDKYNNSELIKQIDTRLLVMTTKSDELIPYTQALNIYEDAPFPKEMVVYSGASHTTLYNLRNYLKIMEWLEK